MKCSSALSLTVACALAFAPAASLFAAAAKSSSQPIPSRHLQGSERSFLSLRDADGHVIAVGDFTQVAHTSTVTDHIVFHFHDGSVDDETTVFSQRGSLRLISDHHIQNGPSFTKPMDLLIDATHGRVVSRTKDKDGKSKDDTTQMKLPPDLANGLVSQVLQNISPTAPETKVPMLVLAPKPRLVTLDITPHGQSPFTVLGGTHQALHFVIKIDIGGIAGVVAPIIGKQPADIDLWIISGDAPTFLREQGQFFEDGPIWTMELASPEWPKS